MTEKKAKPFAMPLDLHQQAVRLSGPAVERFGKPANFRGIHGPGVAVRVGIGLLDDVIGDRKAVIAADELRRYEAAVELVGRLETEVAILLDILERFAREIAAEDPSGSVDNTGKLITGGVFFEAVAAEPEDASAVRMAAYSTLAGKIHDRLAPVPADLEAPEKPIYGADGSATADGKTAP